MPPIETYKRIFDALSLERHQTIRHLARLLFPKEYAETPQRIYDRLAKNLQKLEKTGLLKSDSYGLGEEKFWRIFTSKTDRPKKHQDRSEERRVGKECKY